MTRNHVTQRLVVTSLLGAAAAGCSAAEERRVITMAVEEAGPSAIAVTPDDANVYWTNTYEGTVRRVTKSADVEPTAVEDSATTFGLDPAVDIVARGIAIQGGAVYWSIGNRLEQGILASGQQTTLVEDAGAGWFIAANAEGVYWTNATAGTVMKKSLADGGEVMLACNQGQPQGIAVDSTYAYWANQSDGTIMKVQIPGEGAGGNCPDPSVLTTLTSAEELNAPYAVAVDAGFVYWTSLDGTVKKVSIQGGTPETLAVDEGDPSGIVVDDFNVYWTSKANGTVMKVPKGSNTKVMIADAQIAPFGIAQDTDTLYWANQGGTVARVKK